MHSLTETTRTATALARILPLGAILLAWELVTRTGLVNPFVFPPVSEILLRWLGLLADGSAFRPLGATLWRALLGLAAAIVVGVPLGILMGRVRWAEWFFEPLFSFAFPLPKIALIPLFVQWFGLFDLSKVMLIFVDCLFPLVIFSYHGAKGRQPDLSLVGAGARHRPLAHALARGAADVAGLDLRRHPGRRRRRPAGGRRHRDGLGRQRPRLTMIRAYRFGDVRTAFATLLDISLIGFALYRGAQWLRTRLLSWHTTEA